MTRAMARAASTIVLLTATAALFSAPRWARADGLSVGDMAPPLALQEFVKGTPVYRLPTGRISVVEFWATWCPPCRESIPHLTEMAKQYPQIMFLGVDVWENDTKLVAPFVTAISGKMDYHVATDRVPTGGQAMEGAMAKTWMAAAGQNGIPTAFIVDGNDKILWIGYPWVMAEPLAKIAAGQWNIADAQVQFKKTQMHQQQVTALQQKLQQEAKVADQKAMLATLDELFALDSSYEAGQLGSIKFNLMRIHDTSEASQAYGTHLIETVDKDNPTELSNLAWAVVAPSLQVKSNASLIALALKAARQADTLTQGKDATSARVLAAAFYASGDSADAVAAQMRAIQVAGPSIKIAAQLQTELALYQKGAATNK